MNEQENNREEKWPLKRCPFCGGLAMMQESVRLHLTEVGYCHMQAYSVLCQDKGCIGNQSEKFYWTHTGAANAWNRRAGDG